MSEKPFRSGWVTLIGPPNAGKSTLMNNYMGMKMAIVSPKAQTTRNQINAILTDKEAQVVFLDTPGINEKRGKVYRFLMQSAWQALTTADVVLVVIDAELAIRKPDAFEKELEMMAQPVNASGKKVIVAANKVDMFRTKQKVLPVMERLGEVFPDAEIHPVSALKEEGLVHLMQSIKNALPEGEPLFPEDQITTLPMRFMAAEIIREKLFNKLFQELPYSIAVEIEHWEDDHEKNMARINGLIYVSRPQHKSMVIGKGGKLLKEVGSEARKDIEELIGKKVYLEMWVKVREGWTEDPGFLRGIGLSE